MTRLRAIPAAIGLEGAFLIIGTACLAIAASYVHPAGPALVVGIVALLVALLIAVPTRRDEDVR